MIVPDFKIRQSDTHLQIFIRLPYIKVSSCEFYLQRHNFKFYLKPYLLSLPFQQPILQTEQPSKAIYYHQKHVLEVHLQKEEPGMVFQKLELIQSVIGKQPKPKNKNVGLVQVIGGGVVQDNSSQKNQFGYGFCGNYSKVMDNLQQQTAQLFAFDAKQVTRRERFKMAKNILYAAFDADSYLFDKHQNQQQIQAVIKDTQWKKYLQNLMQKCQKGVQVSSADSSLRKLLNRKQILVPQNANQYISMQMMTICFSYCYQLICMCGQFGPQSAKTINMTSTVLYSHCLLQENTLEQVLIDCYQRCLTYSLYKHIQICKEVHKMIGKSMCVDWLKAILMDLKRLFEASEPRYLLNQMYINDYLVYLYTKGDHFCQKMTQKMLKMQIKEQDLKLPLDGEESQQQDSQESQNEKNKDQIQKNHQQIKVLIEQIQKMQTLD